MKRLNELKSSLSDKSNLLLLLVISFLAVLRLTWLPGVSFNQQYWDDEIAWLEDSKSRSPIDYLFYRDAPGYFVLIPRLTILLSEIHPNLGSFTTLRIIVLVIQLVCFAAAVTCVQPWKKDWRTWLLLFTTFNFIYVEDMNYIHNLGYFFVFPIFLLSFGRIAAFKPVRHYHLVFCLILVSKPFTAVTVLALSLFFYRTHRNARKVALIIGAYSIFYLATYLLLPHRWDTPFDLEFSTFIKIILNFPWILISTLLPSLTIGAMGVTKYFDLFLLRECTGLALYLFMLFFTFKFRHSLLQKYRQFSLKTKGFLIAFVLNYILVFSASDSYWIKFFPLYRLESPQFLWMRWSSVLPFFAVIIISGIQSITLRRKSVIYVFVLSQWIVILIFGKTWFTRYW